MADDKKHEKAEEKKHAHGDGPPPAKAEGKAAGGEKAAAAKGAGAPKGKGRKEKAPATITAAPGKAKAKGDKAARLAGFYKQSVVPNLMKEFGFKNPMQVPKLEKIVVNMGLGEAISNNKLIEQAEEQMMTITGQKGVVTRSRKSIANFKLRENQPIGCMVTLRRDRMYEFFDRLVSVALPRVRDFKGVSTKAFDGKGNYTLGVKEQIIFPEINYDKIEKIKGMNITIVTTAKNDEEGRALLKHMGMPFRSA
jgi:large subunit ribosomal protein L5